MFPKVLLDQYTVICSAMTPTFPIFIVIIIIFFTLSILNYNFKKSNSEYDLIKPLKMIFTLYLFTLVIHLFCNIVYIPYIQYIIDLNLNKLNILFA